MREPISIAIRDTSCEAGRCFSSLSASYKYAFKRIVSMKIERIRTRVVFLMT